MTARDVQRATPGAITGIDCHAHVLRRDAPLAAERHSAPARDVDVDEFLAVQDAHGISHGVLIAPSFYGTNNEILLRALDAHPQRLRGTVIVDPGIDLETLQAIQRRGAVGIRLNWIRRATLPDCGDRAWTRLFESVRRLGWHIEVYLEGRKLADVLPLLRQSGAAVVVDHFGSPDPARGLECAGFREVLRGVREGDTWIKLSAPYRLGGADPQRYVDALLDAGAGRQLVWASDWPFVSHENEISYLQCTTWLRQWIPDEDARRVILVDTPAKLFHFDHDPSSSPSP